MSYMLQHLHNGYQVDQAILSEEDRVVVRKSQSLETKFDFSHFSRDLYHFMTIFH